MIASLSPNFEELTRSLSRGITRFASRLYAAVTRSPQLSTKSRKLAYLASELFKDSAFPADWHLTVVFQAEQVEEIQLEQIPPSHSHFFHS